MESINEIQKGNRVNLLGETLLDHGTKLRIGPRESK